MARTAKTAGVSPRTIRRLFATAVALGAFLLFMVQPLAARLALARGGGPLPWTVALLIYQAALLAGLAYAAAIRRWPPRAQAALQLLLLILVLLWAAVELSAAPAAARLGSLGRGPARLALAAGPLAAVLAAQAPLLQRWLLLRQPGAHPFPLLLPAQVGGIAGLIAYMLLAPMLGAAVAWPWLGGYVALVGLVGGAAATLPRRKRRLVANVPATLAPTPLRRLEWLVLAALPFALTVATTARLGAASGAMPPPWLVPLGVYLLSLPVAFARDGRVAAAIGGSAAAVMIIAGSLAFPPAALRPAIVPMLGLVLLFAVCVALHAELHRRRPDPAHAAGFHLVLAGGALLGGALAAIAPPLLGASAYPLLILAAAAFVRHRPLALFEPLSRRRAWGQWLALWLPLTGLLLSLVAAGLLEPFVSRGGRLGAALAVGALAFAAIGRRWLFVGLIGLTMLAFGGWEAIGVGF